MGIQAFKVYAITTTNVPQPCFGTTLTTSISPGAQNPDGTFQPITITVADTSMLLQGYMIDFDYGQTTQESTHVYSVTDGTHFKARIGKPHSAYVSGQPGGFVVLRAPNAAVTVQGKDGSTGDYFFGNGPSFNDTFTATNGAGMFFVARKSTAGQQPPFMTSYNIFGLNPVNTNQFWIQGTANDVFLPSFIET